MTQITQIDQSGPLPPSQSGSVVVVADTVDSTGAYWFSLGSCAQTPSYNPDGTIAYIDATDPISGFTFRQSFTYAGGLWATQSKWVKQ